MPKEHSKLGHMLIYVYAKRGCAREVISLPFITFPEASLCCMEQSESSNSAVSSFTDLVNFKHVIPFLLLS